MVHTDHLAPACLHVVHISHQVQSRAERAEKNYFWLFPWQSDLLKMNLFQKEIIICFEKETHIHSYKGSNIKYEVIVFSVFLSLENKRAL